MMTARTSTLIPDETTLPQHPLGHKAVLRRGRRGSARARKGRELEPISVTRAHGQNEEGQKHQHPGDIRQAIWMKFSNKATKP